MRYPYRKNYVRAPAPWNPRFNLPSRMRRIPIEFLQAQHYPAFDRMQAALEADHRGGSPEISAFLPRKHGPRSAGTAIPAIKAVSKGRQRLRDLRSAALRAVGAPDPSYVPPPNYPTRPPARKDGLFVPNVPPPGQRMAVYRVAAAAQQQPLPFVRGRRRAGITDPGAIARRIQGQVIYDTTGGTESR